MVRPLQCRTEQSNSFPCLAGNAGRDAPQKGGKKNLIDFFFAFGLILVNKAEIFPCLLHPSMERVLVLWAALLLSQAGIWVTLVAVQAAVGSMCLSFSCTVLQV